MLGVSWQVERFEDIGSTNTHLLEAARAGAPEGRVAVADHQSAGRGRLDRRWEAPAGSSLLVSVLLRPKLEVGQAHLVTAAVALSARAAVERCSGLRPDLKWPNDLVVGGAKLAGILAESDRSAPGGPPGTTAIVVGMGLNLTWPGPEGAGGTSLAEASGVVVPRDELLDAYLAELAERRRLLDGAEGRRALAEQLAACVATIGQEVVVSVTSGTLRGMAVGLSAEGHLLVETATGVVEVVTGDVTSVRGAPGADLTAE
jgi:BirA family transcriptional regulator, biotin operon repressor / biotin---[acetyl-CoA-carboxylase] ligase